MTFLAVLLIFGGILFIATIIALSLLMLTSRIERGAESYQEIERIETQFPSGVEKTVPLNSREKTRPTRKWVQVAVPDDQEFIRTHSGVGWLG